jgi:Uma2 family endonuclease
MVRIVDESTRIGVPGWVTDIESFRRWVEEDDFPRGHPVWWLKGEVWIDLSNEQVFSHLLVKTEITMVLGPLAKTEQLGLFLGDRVLLSNFAAEVSGNPDAMFFSHEALDSDRVRLIEGKRGGYTEIHGSPDMVLEVVSTSSVEKDYEVLRQAYWEADVPEYWLVDARKEPLKFDILRHTARGYVASRKQDGWVRSAVFGKSFRLTEGRDHHGHPAFTLSVR